MREGAPWFVAGDVCRALDMNLEAGTAQWLKGLDADEKDTMRNSQGGRVPPYLTILNESGLYALILNSRKPEARAFKKWVTSVAHPRDDSRGPCDSCGSSGDEVKVRH